ncbi:MAG: DUF4038 domain-containing protein [Planctomycetota bacterium]
MVTDTGEPFFWLGDTAWEMLHRLDREETLHYLDVRARQGFNVIQTVLALERCFATPGALHLSPT